VTDTFFPLAQNEADTFGIPDLPTIVIPHPVAILNGDEVMNLAINKLTEVMNFLNQDEKVTDKTMIDNIDSPNTVQLSDNLIHVNNYFISNGYTDGLPIIPPEKTIVDQFIEKSGMQADKIIGLIAPQNGIASILGIAINSVMAGCEPTYMPVIISAIKAMIEPKFNLRGVQTTTHPCAPLVLINGPIIQELQLNSKNNAFGQGNRANATIGRALRLILQNIGGAYPGDLDRATQGQPSKYSFCIAENENQNPWEPFHVDRNFDPAESTVTVFAGENPHNVNDHMSSDPLGLMATISDCCCTMGMNNTYLTKSEVLLCLCPEHAAILFNHGWDKAKIREYIWENSRKTIKELKRGGMFNMAEFPDYIDINNEKETVPIVEKPDDILIIVLGGPGKHSSFIPSFGLTRSVTKKIQTY
jgi:hypothetical protein